MCQYRSDFFQVLGCQKLLWVIHDQKFKLEFACHGQEGTGRDASLYNFWNEFQKHYLSLYKISDYLIFIYLSYLFFSILTLSYKTT